MSDHGFKSKDPFRKGAAGAEASRDAHLFADKDFGPDSLHHSLGTGPTQAAPGNHGHFFGFATGPHSQSLASATFVTIAGYLAVTGNQGGMLNTTTGLFTVPKTGVWMLNASCYYTATNGGNHRLVMIFLNGTETLRASGYLPIGAAGQGIAASTVWFLTKGDTVDVRDYQDTGGAINFDRLRFSAVLLS